MPFWHRNAGSTARTHFACELQTVYVKLWHSQPAGWGQVWAMLVEVRTEQVAGFDLSQLDCYRWHPQQDPILLDRYGLFRRS